MKTNFSLQKQNAFLIIYSASILLISFLSNSETFAQSWNPLSTGTNGTIYASTIFNGNLIIAGDFTIAGGLSTNHIAKWNGSSWSALGSGSDSSIYTLTIFNGDLIAGGRFLNAGGTGCNRVARWNGTLWSPLGLGVNDAVYALVVYSGNLRAGGFFSTAGGIPCSNIASWDGFSWSAMGTGVNDIIRTMALYGADLYIGGRFTIAGLLPNKRITRYISNGFYLPLGSGIDSGTVLSLFVYGGTLAVGGNYTSIGGISVNYLASWNGINWNTIGNGMNASVNSLGTYSGNLIAGGSFTSAGGTPANHIASWNGINWMALGTGMSGGITAINTISTWSNILIAGGNFDDAGGIGASNVAAYGSIPTLPTLIGPCSTQNDSLTPLLTWNPVNNATAYGLQISVDPNFSTTIINTSGIPITQYQVGPGVLSYGTTYFWKVNASNGLGTGPWSLTCFFTTENPLGIIKNQKVPTSFKLYQNYPNPFNPSTVIKFDLPPDVSTNSKVQLKLYNIEGKEILTLFEHSYKPGSYEIKFVGENLASGIYFYKIIAGDFVTSNKMVLIK
jgi:hypothetical protein